MNTKCCAIICVEVNDSGRAIQEILQCVENNDAHVEIKADILPKETIQIQKKFDIKIEDVDFGNNSCQYVSISV